jgi:hypothetical protein
MFKRDLYHQQLCRFTIFHATNSTEVFTMADRRLQAGLEYTVR